MKKILATTALPAAFLFALTGCSVGVEAPAPEPGITSAPPASGQPSAEASATETESVAAALTESAECTGGEPVTLAVENAAVEFTGTCGDVTITADTVTAQFEQVGNVSLTGSLAAVQISGSSGDLSVLGDKNTVIGKDTGALAVDGSTNSVSVEAATSVEVGGSDNTVGWTSGASEGAETGTGNTLIAPGQ